MTDDEKVNALIKAHRLVTDVKRTLDTSSFEWESLTETKLSLGRAVGALTNHDDRWHEMIEA